MEGLESLIAGQNDNNDNQKLPAAPTSPPATALPSIPSSAEALAGKDEEENDMGMYLNQHPIPLKKVFTRGHPARKTA